MNIEREDLEAYAMGFWRRWGSSAHGMAVKQAHDLRSARDKDGFEVWMAVATCIESISGKRRG